MQNDDLTPEQKLWEAVVYMTVHDYVMGVDDKNNDIHHSYAHQVSKDLLFGYTADCFNGMCLATGIAASTARRKILDFLNRNEKWNFANEQNLGRKILGRHNFKEDAKYIKSPAAKKRREKRLMLKLVKQ